MDEFPGSSYAFANIYFRYTNQEKYAEAIDLLYDGAMKLSEHGQHHSAADLCMLLVDTLKKADNGMQNLFIQGLFAVCTRIP